MINISIPENCVVCNSPFVFYVRDIPTRRTKKEIPLYYCMECESFSNPSGYSEDEKQLHKDLNWNIGVIERNMEASERLLKKLTNLYPQIKSVLEIGCGIGTTLYVARNYFPRVKGYDINHYAVNYGIEKFELDLKCEMWDAGKTEPFDLILCISVLEHLEDPRKLFSELAKSAFKSGGALFVSVPFLDRNRWKYILNPEPTVEGTPFFDNDVHITHFSTKGLNELALQNGCTSATFIAAGWAGYIFEFDKNKFNWITQGKVRQINQNTFEFENTDENNIITYFFRQPIKSSQFFTAEITVTVFDCVKLALSLNRRGKKKIEGNTQKYKLDPGTHTISIEHTFLECHTGSKLQLRFDNNKPSMIDSKKQTIEVYSPTVQLI